MCDVREKFARYVLAFENRENCVARDAFYIMFHELLRLLLTSKINTDLNDDENIIFCNTPRALWEWHSGFWGKMIRDYVIGLECKSATCGAVRIRAELFSCNSRFYYWNREISIIRYPYQEILYSQHKSVLDGIIFEMQKITFVSLNEFIYVSTHKWNILVILHIVKE